MKLFLHSGWSVPNHINKRRMPRAPVKKKRIKSNTERNAGVLLKILNDTINKNNIVKTTNGENRVFFAFGRTGFKISCFTDTRPLSLTVELSKPFNK